MIAGEVKILHIEKRKLWLLFEWIEHMVCQYLRKLISYLDVNLSICLTIKNLFLWEGHIIGSLSWFQKDFTFPIESQNPFYWKDEILTSVYYVRTKKALRINWAYGLPMLEEIDNFKIWSSVILPNDLFYHEQ